MRSAHTVAEVRAAEAEAFARTPDGFLMQCAARGLATAVADMLGSVYGRRVVLLIGSGDNGGDALHAGAWLARRGAQVSAVLLADRHHQAGLSALLAAGGRVRSSTGGPMPDVVIDGIVGIGASGPLRGPAAAVVASYAGVPTVAVDIPSGVEVDTGRVVGPHVDATLTVTFGTHKVAHLVDPAALACGVVHLVDIGLELPPAAVTSLQEIDVVGLLPRPEPTAHKYTRGVVGLRTGSARYPGAAVLSTAGAGCGLAGMVRYAGSAADRVSQAHPEVVCDPGRVQAWVVGSGTGEEAPDAVRAALADGVPLVLDAEALDQVSGPLAVPTVLTPHAGELARMTGADRAEIEAAPLDHARAAARRFGSVVLLKGRHSLIVDPSGRARVTTVGPPWLATAGAGDVLAGLIGTLLAAGLSCFDAASVGSWVHGAAATMASAGGPLTAGAVAASIAPAVRHLTASIRPADGTIDP